MDDVGGCLSLTTDDTDNTDETQDKSVLKKKWVVGTTDDTEKAPFGVGRC